MTAAFLAAYLTLAPLHDAAAAGWQSALPLAAQVGQAEATRLWRDPQPLRIAEPTPLYARVGDRWPLFVVEAGRVDWYAEHYDGGQWWVYVTVRGTNLSGWIEYDDTAR